MIDIRDQVHALSRAFFARFFESEITTGTDDLKGAFFWLLATLAVPGVFIPWLRVWDWQLLALISGPEAVRVASRSDKTFYLGLSMVASGMLATVAWGSLLPDRRDTLILGALPVKPAVVVTAKLVALAQYVGLVSLFMHAGAAVFWGALLGDAESFAFVLRGMTAHFVASSAAGITVCLFVAGAQGMLLAIAGPRVFSRAATLLQVAVVGLVAIGLAYLPLVTSSVVETLAAGSRATGPKVHPWILNMPQLWFLGLYEQLLGTTDPLLGALARRAWIATAAAVALPIITYPIAYRRLMVSVVETGSVPKRRFAQRLQSMLVRAAGRAPAVRATAEFFTVTLARVERQRFVLAIAFGLAVAWGLPGWRAYSPGATPVAALLGFPLAAMMFLLVGLRVASSLPSDTRAAWIFEVHHLSRREARQGTERVMFLAGVLPAALISAAAFWWMWGGRVALTHAGVMAAIGITLLELLIWHCDGMPCGQRWTPARADFGRRWPLHLAIFLFVVSQIPRLELLLFRKPYGTVIFVTGLLMVALGARYASARHTIVPVYEEIDPVAGVLRLQ